MAELLPPRRGEFLTADGQPTLRFITWIESLTTISNTTTDTTDILSSLSPGIAANVALEKRVSDLEILLDMGIGGALSNFIKDFNIVTVTANYTTTGNEIIVCNNTTAIDITLNTGPADKESVHVIRQNTGPVNVLGPALGDTSLTIGSRYWSPHFTYIQELSTWVVV